MFSVQGLELGVQGLGPGSLGLRVFPEPASTAFLRPSSGKGYRSTSKDEGEP